MKNQVAQTILNQLGGNKFVAMTGAHSLTADANSLTFKFGKNESKFFACKIELTAMDDYTMTFYKWRKKFDLEQVSITGVYCDQLTDIFTQNTGLYTSL